MRTLRFLPFLVVLLVSPLAWPQQTTSPQRDSQAVAVAQASLNALGGATAIGHIQSWTIRANMKGPMANGNVTYTIDTQPSKLTYKTKRGTTRSVLIRSFFVPVVLGAVLAKELQNPLFAVQYPKPSAANSQAAPPVLIGPPASFGGQAWYFNSKGLPARVEFHLPAELGSKVSWSCTVDFSNYHNVGGVLYPFLVVTHLPLGLPEVITVQSITPSGTLPDTSASPTNIQAGDSL